MNIIVGATGQVGSSVISEINRRGFPVRAIARNPEKVKSKTFETRKADLFNVDEMTKAFEGGSSVFVLTPENPASEDIIGDTKMIVQNYVKAIRSNGIKRVIGLSCVGAHIDNIKGNILMSRILEQELRNVEAETIFIRPSYYYSNWMAYWDTVDKHGILPTFFPEDLKIEMHAPIDVAKFIAEVIINKSQYSNRKFYELVGQRQYSSRDIANDFSMLLNKQVETQTIPKEKWNETLLSVGFTENTATNLSEMTQAVIDKMTVPEEPSAVIKLPTTFKQFMECQLEKQA